MLTILTLLFACGGASHDHDHGEHDHPHTKAAPADAEPAAAAEQAPLGDPTQEVAVGEHTLRLYASAGTLTLALFDENGAATPATGKARVVLTGTGQAPQKLVLDAAGTRWSGPASVEGAPGYLAIAFIQVDGAPQSARLTWGSVPEAAEVKHPHEAGGDHVHGDGQDHGHDHDHGHPH